MATRNTCYLLQYNFKRSYDIVRFFKEIHNTGMHAIAFSAFSPMSVPNGPMVT